MTKQNSIKDDIARAEAEQAEAPESEDIWGPGHLFQLEVQQTYTPAHVFLLQDALADRIRTYTSKLGHDQALDIARGLLSDDLTNLPTLNTLALAADARPTERHACADPSCDGPHGHEHGTRCGHLCACGRGE
ncbi:hypothetical protein Leucomu_11225 [Leucobacter muris]|uniref:DUF222 domain-containing protein n=1 Tax=Leucobacter muris TaxID=1935379 RepID=A0ABX5QHA7_9MICO|nr:hypothetical protein [Leucobacter muris]QAB18410.1 hypothetical protein Leucomu_11225 [Leucobacter muris]